MPLIDMWNDIINTNSLAGQSPMKSVDETHGVTRTGSLRAHVATAMSFFPDKYGSTFDATNFYGVNNSHTIQNLFSRADGPTKKAGTNGSYNDDATVGGSNFVINTQAPPGKTDKIPVNPQANRQDGAAEVAIKVATPTGGGAGTVVLTSPMPGSNESNGGKSQATVIMQSQASNGPTPENVAFEDQGQKALQSVPDQSGNGGGGGRGESQYKSPRGSSGKGASNAYVEQQQSRMRQNVKVQKDLTQKTTPQMPSTLSFQGSANPAPSAANGWGQSNRR